MRHVHLTTSRSAEPFRVRHFGLVAFTVIVGLLAFGASPAAAGESRASKPADQAPAAAVAAVAVAASCYGSTCNGKDPQAQGCSAGARTLESRRSANSIYYELRYSPNCHAAWTRYTNILGDAGTIYIRGSSNTYSKHAAGYVDETGWTPMVSFAQYVRGCVVFWRASWGEWQESCTGTY